PRKSIMNLKQTKASAACQSISIRHNSLRLKEAAMQRHAQATFRILWLGGAIAAALLACTGRANAQTRQGGASSGFGGSAGSPGSSSGGSFSFSGGSGSLSSGFGSSGSFSGGGTSGSMNGGGFSGGTGFSGGSSAGFGGGGAMTGGTGGAGFRGGAGGVGGASGFTSPGGANTGNPFGPYYSNPMAMGMGRPGQTTMQPTGIGQPLYNSTGTNLGNTGGLAMTGGAGNRGGL